MQFHHRAVPIVLAAVLIDTIGFGIILPAVPALIEQLGHVDMAHATAIGGWLLVVFASTQFIAGPIIGSLSDRYGRRPVLVASMLAFSIDFALTAFAPTLAWLFLGRAVAGIAGAVYAPATSVIADVTPPEKRAATFGLIGAAFGFGFIIGPAIGGLLGDLGPRAPFFVASALALINAVAMLFLLPETLAPENVRQFDWRAANVVGAFRPLFRAGNAAPLLIAWFLWQIAHNVYPATWSFWATITLGWDSSSIGWSLAWSGAMMATIQAVLTGRVIARFGMLRTVTIGLISGAGAFLALAFARDGWTTYILLTLGSFQGFVFAAMSGLMSSMVGPDRQGALQGGVSAMTSMSSIIGPLILTQALSHGAAAGFPGAAFLLAGSFAAVALAILVVIGRRHAVARRTG